MQQPESNADDSIPAPGPADDRVVPEAGFDGGEAGAPASDDIAVQSPFEILREAFAEKDPGLLREWAASLIESRLFWIDLGMIALSILLAVAISRFLLALVRKNRTPAVSRLLAKLGEKRSLSPFRLTLVAVMWVTLLIANRMGFPCPMLRTWSLIITIFAFINLPRLLDSWRSWMHLFTSAIFVLAVLHVLGVLDDVAGILEGLRLELGELSVTVLDIVKGIMAYCVLFFGASLLSNAAGKRIGSISDLDANVQVLARKSVRVSLHVLAILIAMAIMGIPITALAVFGGALGLGLGFGLQKVVSNLVSGVILLVDKSIKPGDVIEIEGTYGWINSLNLRYVSVITRDNKEHLIPNEDLITNPVINWSYSSKLVRIRAPFGISYGSDVRLAMQLAEEAAAVSPRIVSHPAPRCNLMGFGDSSVDFELRFWIEDPSNGVGRVRSQVLLAIWDAFAENGIEFPFPQRDVHLRLEDRELLEKLVASRSSEA